MDAGKDHQTVVRDVSEADARAELDRLLSDPRFHATDRAKKVLRYIAEAFFAGETEGVKAYAIALDVLGRSPRFDPNTDPIVRIELSRLRSALAAYYEAYGTELDINIQLPIGRYLTVFSRSSDTVKPLEETPLVDDFGVHARPPRVFLYPFLLLTTSGVMAVALFSGWLLWEAPPIITSRPVVTIEIAAVDERYRKEADRLGDHLVTALSKFRTLSIDARQSETDPAQSTTGTQKRAYRLQLKYIGDTGSPGVWWQVVDAATDEVLASDRERVSLSEGDEEAEGDDIVTLLARKLAPTRGIISNIEILGDRGERGLGNICVLRAEFELEEGSQADIKSAQACLRKTLEIQPSNSDAAATLARTLIETEEGQIDSEVLGRAQALARQAVSLDPVSDRALVALMMVQFRAGNIAPAISAGQRALSLNPDNPDVLAKLAVVMLSAGEGEVAISLALDAFKGVDSVPPDARLVVALDAYRRGDFSSASLMAEQISRADVVVVALMAAALGELNSPAARERLDELSQLLPDYETALPLWMSRRRFDPAITASLENGLRMAKRESAPLRQEE